ncbi:hypothetical protein TNCV_2179471 [Trichonephila clavipes]|uniref:Uncharacterized protein n=1 Tax=Trichonephila clavipes TaxID=2585209 RepID=A0A8X6VUL3_TRICX|nr:hypothetical protein TNCV_2179471 [Trichonephila clavipes]
MVSDTVNQHHSYFYRMKIFWLFTERVFFYPYSIVLGTEIFTDMKVGVICPKVFHDHSLSTSSETRNSSVKVSRNDKSARSKSTHLSDLHLDPPLPILNGLKIFKHRADIKSLMIG